MMILDLPWDPFLKQLTAFVFGLYGGLRAQYYTELLWVNVVSIYCMCACVWSLWICLFFLFCFVLFVLFFFVFD